MTNFSIDYSNFEARLNITEGDFRTSMASLSEKYSVISSKARDLFQKNEFTTRKIRTWSMQDDMGVPVQIRRFAKIDQYFFENLLRFCRQILPLNWLSTYFQKSALLDDLKIIESVGALDILKEQPVSTTPHVRDIYRHKGYEFNSRYLRYVYLADQIRKYELLHVDKRQTYVDVGNFYGGLQGLLKNYYPNTTFISVELPHQLFRSFLYHSDIFPDVEKIVGLKEYKKHLENTNRKSVFVYLLPSDFDEIGKLTEVDLLSNYLSFGEMSDENFHNYYNSETLKKSKKLHFVNRFISSPKMDPTFESSISLLNYLIPGAKLKLLDIFPIHHYMITKRKLLGRKGYRNVSSPQYELIQENI